MKNKWISLIIKYCIQFLICVYLLLFINKTLVKFNKTKDTGLNFLSGSMIREIAEANNLSCKEIPDSKLTSNTIFILKAAN